MASQYFAGSFSHLVSNASLTDVTPPTFSGIASLVAQPNGALLATWSAATDTSIPIEYVVYIAANTVTADALFISTNVVAITSALSVKLFTDATQTYLSAGTVYTVGVRAKDAVGNINQNTVLYTAVSAGVLSDSLAASVIQLNADLTRLEQATSIVMVAAL